MIYYRVCYFILNPLTGKWEIIKEYPLSQETVFTRVKYLSKSILSFIWLEEVKSPSICEDCEHFDWDVEKYGSYCCLHKISVPWDWSCSDFDFIK